MREAFRRAMPPGWTGCRTIRSAFHQIAQRLLDAIAFARVVVFARSCRLRGAVRGGTERPSTRRGCRGLRGRGSPQRPRPPRAVRSGLARAGRLCRSGRRGRHLDRSSLCGNGRLRLARHVNQAEREKRDETADDDPLQAVETSGERRDARDRSFGSRIDSRVDRWILSVVAWRVSRSGALRSGGWCGARNGNQERRVRGNGIVACKR